VRQTHISVLFFTEGRVYKVKKPIDLGFVDYSTLEMRRHFCHEEVRLNSRLSPEVYLGVVGIIAEESGNLRIGREVEPNVIDYAVEMVRLPQDRMLSALLERGEVDNAQMNAIAQRMAEFHRHCPTGPGVDEYAAPDEIRRQMEDNFAQIEPFINDLASATLHAALRRWCRDFLTANKPMLHDRVSAGRIREGHGDLHAENICILPARETSLVIYDCIEFTPRFRCRDVCCEIAFLAMDLDYRGYRGFARFITHEYAQLTGDETFHQPLDFYKLHLAIVRCKVAALTSRDETVGEDERREARLRAMGYAHLAATYAIGPALIIMCGLPGSGKSWAARAITRPFEALILHSDVIRKRLAGIEPTQRALERIYQPEFTQRTYAAMLEQAEAALQSGRTVIADGTFMRIAQREPFIELARRLNVPFLLVQTQATDREIQRRMKARLNDSTEVSDADWQVYKHAKPGWQPLDEIRKTQRVVLRGRPSPEQAASAVIDSLLANPAIAR
jgi:uncharacterized protein